MDGTIIQQGSFISDGENKTIQLRSDVDWMRVINYSNIAGNTQFDGTEFYWQRGFAANDGIVSYHGSNASQDVFVSTAAVGVNGAPVGGFTLVDSSVQTPGVAIAITAGPAAISTANPPRVAVASTALLRDGDIVRLSNIIGAPQLAGIDFTIDVADATHFDLLNAPQIAVAGTAGFYRKINFDPIFYPRRRVVTVITQAVLAEVLTSVSHGYTIGQEVRFSVPAAFGMVEIDGLSGTIVNVTDNSFFVNIDSSTFTPFVFPTAAGVPFTPAEVIPFGEDTALALSSGQDILADATINTGYIGIILAGGDASPGGAAQNVMYWVAGKSFNV
jgi:hypothetical protein